MVMYDSSIMGFVVTTLVGLAVQPATKVATMNLRG